MVQGVREGTRWYEGVRECEVVRGSARWYEGVREGTSEYERVRGEGGGTQGVRGLVRRGYGARICVTIFDCIPMAFHMFFIYTLVSRIY